MAGVVDTIMRGGDTDTSVPTCRAIIVRSGGYPDLNDRKNAGNRHVYPDVKQRNLQHDRKAMLAK